MRRLLLSPPACSPAPRRRALNPAPAGSFSIVVLPDTQHYLGQGTKLQPDTRTRSPTRSSSTT